MIIYINSFFFSTFGSYLAAKVKQVKPITIRRNTRSSFNGEFLYRSPHFCLGAGNPVVSDRTLAIFSLPVEQYPDLAPPNVRVTANYPGASAQTLENTVTQVIEQNMTGLDNLMYMSSQSSGTGQASVTLSFKAGTDPTKPSSRYKTSCNRPCESCRRRYRIRGHGA